MDLIATSTFGLEAVVTRELKALGYDDCQTLQNGRVLFQGDAMAIARTNLWLRASDRVLLCMGSFAATDFGVLFDQTSIRNLFFEIEQRIETEAEKNTNTVEGRIYYRFSF